ncbi:unnamed protein product [Allacma fusca]|uniref:Uncharacterized protein n=1 Tax=Allacma fusca TaxID=39272 RepID=A0A8J2JGT0_9HEXA|nr:unnamed protein product [Allacma fusca]
MSENFGISSLPEPVQKGVIGMIYSQEERRCGYSIGRAAGTREGALHQNLIENPVATLYTGKNFTGNFEYYNYFSKKSFGGCFDLEEFWGRIESVDTGGTCIRIFSDWSCKKCEFDYVTLEDYPDSPNKLVRKIESKVKAFANVPDLIPDFFTRSGLTSVTVNYGFNHQYLLGATDQVGYAIPLELGGPAALNFFYENGTGRRPAGIWYSMFRHLAMVASTGMDTSAIKYRLNAEGAVD